MGNCAPTKYYKQARLPVTAGGHRHHCIDSYVFDINQNKGFKGKKYYNKDDAKQMLTLERDGSGEHQFCGYAGELANEEVSRNYDFYMFQAQEWKFTKLEFHSHRAAIIRHVNAAAKKIYELMFKEIPDDFNIFLVVIDTDNDNFSENVLANTENFKQFSHEKLKQNVDLDSLLLSEDRFLVADVDNILNRVVNGQEGSRPAIDAIKTHLSGLINLGNTCYMNATIQCLAHMRPLREYFKEKFNEDAVNPRESGVQLSVQFYRLLRQMQASGAKITPDVFKKDLGVADSRFGDYSQQDAHICLSTILFNIHDDINEIVRKPYFPNPPSLKEFITIDEVAQQTWNRHIEREKSPIIDIMNGMYVVEKKCAACEYVSPKFDIMHSVALSIEQPKDYKGNGTLNLIDLLKYDREPQTVEDYECFNCNSRSTAQSTIKIYRAPSILIFQIKRFKKERGRYVVDETPVDYPLELNMHDFCEDKENDIMKYRLFSVIVHQGSLDEGHYYSYGLNDRDQWVQYDDAKVSMVDSPKSKDAYILFYERI